MLRFWRNIGFIGLMAAMACQTDKPTPSPEPFIVTAPENLGKTVPFPTKNPFTREGVLLGRTLFYDPTLSANNRISCASCHQPEKAFSDGLGLSDKGISGKTLHR